MITTEQANAKAKRWLENRDIKRLSPSNKPRTSQKLPRGTRKLYKQSTSTLAQLWKTPTSTTNPPDSMPSQSTP